MHSQHDTVIRKPKGIDVSVYKVNCPAQLHESVEFRVLRLATIERKTRPPLGSTKLFVDRSLARTTPARVASNMSR